MSYELTSAQERKRNTEEKAKQYYEKVRTQEQEMRELQRQLNIADKESSQLHAQKTELDDAMRVLLTKIEATNRTIASLRTQVTSKKQSIERDHAEMDRYQEEVVELDRKIGELMRHH